jgi:hypothetical protein
MLTERVTLGFKLESLERIRVAEVLRNPSFEVYSGFSSRLGMSGS